MPIIIFIYFEKFSVKSRLVLDLMKVYDIMKTYEPDAKLFPDDKTGFRAVQDDYRKYFLLGTIYTSLKKIELAEKNLILANKINKNNPSILHNLGTLMAIKGNFGSAKNFYLKAININKNIDSMSEMGRLLEDEK